MTSRPVDVLLVADSPGDVRLVREALKDARLRVNLHVARDGIEAMAFLRREGKYAAAPRPTMVLLDLILPIKDGSEVIAEIQRDDSLSGIPVIVLTDGPGEEYILKAFTPTVSAVLTRPINPVELMRLAQSGDGGGPQTIWGSLRSPNPHGAGPRTGGGDA